MTGKMTKAQAAWLTKLRDDGDQPFSWSLAGAQCSNNGWAKGNAPRDGSEYITPAGLAALAEYEVST